MRRLFFGFDIEAPWPEGLPAGRIIESRHRHLTLAFLGSVCYAELEEKLGSFPRPEFRLGPVACFDKVLFLPRRRPGMVAWQVKWGQENRVDQYHRSCQAWLIEEGYEVDKRSFLPHVTIARGSFSPRQWREDFVPLPLYLSALGLFESLGHSRYETLWSLPLQPPFEEMDQGGSRTWLVRGENLEQLALHAQTALAFQNPAILPFARPYPALQEIGDLEDHLNKLTRQACMEIRAPAWNVHSLEDVVQEGQILVWKMRVESS